MEKVLSITDRIEDKRRRKQVAAYRDRFEAVQRVVQCSACQLKCAMCGRHRKGPEATVAASVPSMESTLCESCRSEFNAFKRISREGIKEGDVFWHNDQWLELWARWIDYQRAIMKFRTSFDFNKLTD